jgi:predicted lactoylglutathione lyase
VPNLVYSEIRVRDLGRSMKFYRALGLVPKSRGKMEDGTSFVWVWDKKTKQLVELWYAPRGSQFFEPFRIGRMFDPRLMISVWSVAPIIRKLKRLGGKLTRDDRSGSVRLSIVSDPDGHSIEILSWMAPQKHARDEVPFLDLVLSPTNL